LCGLAPRPEEDHAEHEIRECVDFRLRGDEPDRGVSDAEAEEAELAEPADHDEWAMHHRLTREPLAS
jgi:hypothetical protein